MEQPLDAVTDDFAGLLRRYRESQHISQKVLAQSVGLTPAMLNYLEAGERRPSRDAVLRIARALRLERADADKLLIAGGHLAAAYDRIPPSDPDLLTVADILGDENIPSTERALLRMTLRIACSRWRPGVLDASRVASYLEPARPESASVAASGFSG